MSREVPSVSEFMTSVPRKLDRSESVARAHELMITEDIRHLPVMDGDQLLGVLSARDVQVILATTRGTRDSPLALDVCELTTYTVSRDKLVTEAALEMELRKVGSAVVLDDDGKVVGIFTLIDALRALRKAYA